MKWFLLALKRYGEFNGRSRRKEYWMFILYYYIFAIIAGCLDWIFDSGMDGGGYYGPITGLYMLAMLIPFLAITVRRLHDIGKSGWMILVALIPIIGEIWLLILLIRNGDFLENRYGLNPKEKEAEF
jgi:uncharacterized membrane protein YhaH (DUF805 family)